MVAKARSVVESDSKRNRNAIANVNVKGEPLKSGSPCVIGQTCECDVRERVEVAESNGADGV